VRGVFLKPFCSQCTHLFKVKRKLDRSLIPRILNFVFFHLFAEHIWEGVKRARKFYFSTETFEENMSGRSQGSRSQTRKSMTNFPYFAVTKGFRPGVYNNWYIQKPTRCSHWNFWKSNFYAQDRLSDGDWRPWWLSSAFVEGFLWLQRSIWSLQVGANNHSARRAPQRESQTAAPSRQRESGKIRDFISKLIFRWFDVFH